MATSSPTRPIGSGPSRDGGEVWTVPEAPQLVSERPKLEPLVVHFRQEIGPEHAPMMHVWKDHSSYAEDVEGVLDRDGWYRHEVKLWTGFPYRCQFWNPTLTEHRRWEHEECVREVKIEGPEERWTLEGDAHWFDHQPRPDRRVIAEIAWLHRRNSRLTEPTAAGVWINRARGWLHPRVDAKPGRRSFAARVQHLSGRADFAAAGRRGDGRGAGPARGHGSRVGRESQVLSGGRAGGHVD